MRPLRSSGLLTKVSRLHARDTPSPASPATDALCPATPLSARQDHPDLIQLFESLSAAEDPRTATLIERRIWDLWVASDRDDVDRLMRRGRSAMGFRDYDAAIETFDRIVELDPEFAEGWNKRATVHFLRRDFAASLTDIARTLALEPRHFGALEGRGMIYEEQGELEKALADYERVLTIRPHVRGLRRRIEQLRREIGQRAT